jgi:hypothetical protein
MSAAGVVRLEGRFGATTRARGNDGTEGCLRLRRRRMLAPLRASVDACAQQAST